MSGVPVRLELGPRDLDAGAVTLVRRLGVVKEQIPLSGVTRQLPVVLDEVQDALLQRATEFRDGRTRTVDSWESFAEAVASGWARALHCGQDSCEDDNKADTAATARCLPLDAPSERGTCVRCGRPSTYGKRVIFGRAY